MFIVHELQLPWALLDFCELAAVSHKLEGREEIEKLKEDLVNNEEEVEDFSHVEEELDKATEEEFKKKAVALASNFGDSSIYRCKHLIPHNILSHSLNTWPSIIINERFYSGAKRNVGELQH